MIRLLMGAASAVLFSCAAMAGGLDAVAEDSEPCPAITIQNDGTMTADIFRQWVAVRSMSCGPRTFIDRQTGQTLTDAEILQRIFNGTRIEAQKQTDVPTVPLAGTMMMLLSALGLAFLLACRDPIWNQRTKITDGLGAIFQKDPE